MSPLFFAEEASGPPLVFLHGFCETHEIWNAFVKPLSTQFRIVMIDLPGFGRSEILPTPFTIDDVGDSVANWLIENKILKSILIGHSLGGYVTLSVAERHSQLLEGFSLFHSIAFEDTLEKRENRNKVIEFVRKNGVQPFIESFVPGLFFDKSSPSILHVEKIASQTKAETLVGYSIAMRDRPDRSSALKSSIPKLLLAGTEDALIPLDVSLKMARMSENSSFFELKNTAHMGFFESEKECQLIIRRFAERIFFNN